MKNFFKKLSFVLAVAMVLTSITPATASAAGKTFIYKSGKVSELADGYLLWVGDKGTDLNVMVNGKKNVAGTWKVGNKAIATIDKNGVVTPKANGKTTVRFTAKTGETDTLKITVGTRASSVKPYVSTDTTKTTITELEMTVGESKDIWLSLPVPSAAKKAGSTSSTFVTDTKGYDESILTVKKNTTRKFTFTANKAGETTITIGAGKPSNKFVKTAEIKVTVVDKLSAKQTGATKITVTGSDLTSDIADYVVKRGTVTVSMAKDVVLNDAKTEAVLTASASVLPAGDYTLSFKKGDAVEFKVETSRIDSIEIVGDTLALTGEVGVASSATVSYKVLNQFTENITKTTGNISVNTSFGTATAAPTSGIITVKNIQNTIIGSTGTMVVINTATGVNVTKTLTLGQKAKAASFEVKGVYNSVTKKEMTLVENNQNLGAVLLIAAFDQYGNRLSVLNTTEAAITWSAGITGVSLDSKTEYKDIITIDGDNYIALPLSAASAKAGTATIFIVSRSTGSNTTATITVGGTTTVKTLDVYPLDTVYAGEDNEFGYVALTEDGTEVKDYATLSSTKYGVSQMPAGFSWVKNLDGTAKLVYDGSASVPAGSEYTMVAGTFITAGYGNKTLTFNVYAAARPTSIGGTQYVTLGLLDSGKSDTTTIDLGIGNFVIFDQYGRAKDFTGNSSYQFKLEVPEGEKTDYVKAVSSGSIVLNSGKEYQISVTTGAITAPVKQTYRVVLEAKNDKGVWKEIAGSDNTFTVTVAPMKSVVSFELKEIPNMYITTASAYQVTPSVTGKLADGTSIKIGASQLTLTGDLAVVGGNKFAASNVSVDPSKGVYSKDVNAVVTVNDAKGTQLKQTVTASVIPPTLTTAMFNPYVSTVATSGGILANVKALIMTDSVYGAKDQYGVSATDKITSDIATILVTDIDSVKGTVNKNNTKDLGFTGTWEKNDLFTISITYKSGLVLTKTFKIQ